MPNISDYLKYANLQMAAEAFLVRDDGSVRDDLIAALIDGNIPQLNPGVDNNEAYQALAGRLSLTPSTAALKDSARNDFAAYAALYSLSPFVFSASAAAQMLAFEGTSNTLYSAWQADKDAWGAGTPVGSLAISDAWLADRANFLERKNWFNAQNKNPVDAQYQPTNEDHAYLQWNSPYFEDRASGYSIQRGMLDYETRRLIFGDETAETLAGSGKEDRLYGGAGDACCSLESQRWRHGDSRTTAANDRAWRKTA